MAVARERGTVPLPPDRAMAMWLDPRRWTMWVDGFQRLGEVPESWPEPGSKLVWHSVPHGRGQVTEKARVYEPPHLFVGDVFEEKLMGRQTVHFEPHDGGTMVSIELEYALTEGGFFQAISDWVFIRPRLREAYRRTLRRFAIEAADEAAPPSERQAPRAS
jgi:hypothetical protein